MDAEAAGIVRGADGGIDGPDNSPPEVAGGVSRGADEELSGVGIGGNVGEGESMGMGGLGVGMSDVRRRATAHMTQLRSVPSLSGNLAVAS